MAKDRNAFKAGLFIVISVVLIIAVIVANGGRSNWFRGIQLIAVYAIFALLFYFVPTR